VECDSVAAARFIALMKDIGTIRNHFGGRAVSATTLPSNVLENAVRLTMESTEDTPSSLRPMFWQEGKTIDQTV
jgi:hypothetical protein